MKAKITTNCLCGHVFKVNMNGEGTYYCPKCKRQWIRYFNQKEYRYEFDVLGERK